MREIRIGTRGSKLALAQTHIVMEKIKSHHPETRFEIIEIKTTGDKNQTVSLDQIGGKGVFIKEIEEALLRKEIDIAVHSLKDMPALLPEELELTAYLEREDAADCLVSRNGMKLAELPPGCVVGTSSLRRVYQLKAARPDLVIEPIRGNVNTRLKKMEDGLYDAIVLASAGLIRLGLQDRIVEKLTLDSFIPGVCQGIIAIETRQSDEEIKRILACCDVAESRTAALCERAFLRKLNGNCKIPVGAYCQVSGDELHLQGMLGDPESTRIFKAALAGTVSEPEQPGTRLAEMIISQIQETEG